MRARTERKFVLTGILHILTLCGFAVAQPLFDLFSRQAEFFVARQADPAEIVIFSVLLTLLVPLPLLMAYLIASLLGYRPGRILLLAVLAGLFAVVSLIAFNQNFQFGAPVTLLLSLLCGLAFAVVYHKFSAMRQLLTIASVSVIAFPLIFFMSGNIRSLVASPEPVELPMTPPNSRYGEPNDNSPPIVFVIFDEWPLTSIMDSAQGIDAQRYPNIAALAATSSWYRNATTVVPVTNYAVPGILAGRYPEKQALPVADHYPQTLFTLLRDSHSPHVFESVTRLCPSDWCVHSSSDNYVEKLKSLVTDVAITYLHMVTPLQYAHYIPAMGHQWGGFSEGERGGPNNALDIARQYKVLEKQVQDAIKDSFDDDRMAVFEKFIAGIQPWNEGRPPFHYMHTLFPHSPWIYYSSGRRYTDDPSKGIFGLDTKQVYWQKNQALADRGYQRHLLHVGLLDKMIGKLIDRLKAVSLFDQALIVMTADHGASFIAGDGYRKLTDTNYQDVLPVPLFIKMPGQKTAAIDDSNVQIIDILPTLAERLQRELVEPIDGVAIGSIEMANRKGKRMYDFYSRWENNPVEIDDQFSQRTITLNRKIGLFGQGEESGLYHYGRHRAVLGKAAAFFSIEPMQAEIVVDQEPFFSNVDLSGEFLPGLISGRVEGEFAQSIESLVFALNGTLQAGAELFEDATGRRAFITVLPEYAFREGHNTLAAYAVSTAAGAGEVALLRPSNQLDVKYHIVGADDGNYRIAGSDGSTLPIVPGAISGYVDRVEAEGRSTRFSGWAADLKGKQVASALMVFVNGQGVYRVAHNGQYRPDSEKYHNLPTAGYSFNIPSAVLEGDNKLQVKVLGVSTDGRASELAYHDWYEWR